MEEPNMEQPQKKTLTKIVLSIAILIVTGGIVLTEIKPFTNFNKQTSEVEIKQYASNGEVSKCSILEIESEKNVYEYSFDNGKTWQKENFAMFCNNEEKNVEILTRDLNGKQLSKSTFLLKSQNNDNEEVYQSKKLTSISFTNDQFTCKVGERIFLDILSNPVNITSRITLKSDKVDAKLLEPIDCENCAIETKRVAIKCLEPVTGEIFIGTEEGLLASAQIIVNEVAVEPNLGTIKFDKPTFSCKVGEKITTIITSTNTTATSYVKEYSSSNSSIASIIKHPTLAVYCYNCVAVEISCNKEGKTILSAKSSTGAKVDTIVNVENKLTDISVEQSENKIYFDKTIYSCSPGKKITATITVEGMNGKYIDTVKSYSTSDTSVATIVKHPTLAVKCINCVAVEITCNKAGKTVLYAESVGGSKTDSVLNVANELISVPVESNANKIYFDKMLYACSPGKKITAVITAEGMNGNALNAVKSYSSSDTSVATIVKHPTLAVKCINCVTVEITCNKVGKALLYAESTSGVKTDTVLNVIEEFAQTPVEPSENKISFDKTIYSCSPGKKITATITASGTSGNVPNTVKSYSSSDTSIATIVKHPTVSAYCINCVTVEITCNKVGKALLHAESTSGSKTDTVLNITNEFTSVTGESSANKISFDKMLYACSPGNKITATITAEGASGNTLNTVKSYSSSDTSVATIVKHPTVAAYCTNCVTVEITCNKVGKALLLAESTSGVKTDTVLNVISTN